MPGLPGSEEPVLLGVKKTILVLSGKGGVGKSTVTGQLAYSLANYYESLEKNIGVLDIDICGPSLPQVFGVQGEQVNWEITFCKRNVIVP